ncbi:AAA family ATPase [Spirosoma arcticum]
MLNSLEIRNYRNLRHLTIDKLGRVNLLVGKNNTGKTSVLEAISILIHQANTRWISQLLDERGESVVTSVLRDPDQLSEYNTERISNLFYMREQKFDVNFTISIKELTESSNINSVNMRFVKYIEIENEEENGAVYRSRTVLEDSDDYDGIGLEITTGVNSRIINLDRRFNSLMLFTGLKANVQFVRTNNIIGETNGQLWDKVILTEKQVYVEDALRLIEKNIQQLAFVNNLLIPNNSSKRDERVAVVKIEDIRKPVSLRSMGDGINRILTIILAMVNCENGYLLIDEFENGLHYSVQEKLWEIIFYLAEQLNVQVFATTHSLDCIEAFSAVINNGKQDRDAGAMIRLENYEGNIEATVYDADEIQATTRVQVDPR